MSPANRNSMLAFAAGVVILMIVLNLVFNGFPFDIEIVAHRTNIIAFDFNAYTIPFFILAGTLIAWKGAAIPALILAVFGVWHGLANAILPYFEIINYVQRGPLFLRLPALSSTAFAVMTLILAFHQPLRGKLDRFRIFASVFFALPFAMHFLAFMHPGWFFGTSMDIFRASACIISFFLMSSLSWCIAFRPASPRAQQTPRS